MAEIIGFPADRISRKKVINEYKKDLTHFLRNAAIIADSPMGKEINGIFIMHQGIKELAQKRIMNFLLKNKMCGSSDLFKCALYVSDLISQNVINKFKSYYAIDYLNDGIKNDNPWIFKDGGDLCFLLCVFFDERRGWRMIKTGDYSKMGSMFYRMFYFGSKKEIGWHMSRQYDRIAGITRHCLKNL